MRCALSTVAGHRSRALLVLLLLPLSTQAATGDIGKHLALIQQLQHDGEYERALAEVQVARQEPHATAQDVTLSLYEGILLFELHRSAEAETPIRQAFGLQPDAKLPIVVAPKIEAAIEHIRKQVPAPPPPAVSVPVEAASTEKTPHSKLQTLVVVPAIAGGAVAIAGGAFYIVSRGKLTALRNKDSSITSKSDAQVVARQGQTYQGLGVGLLGLGAAGLVTAAGMYLFGAPHGSSVSLGVGTDGTSAFVHGRWP